MWNMIQNRINISLNGIQLRRNILLNIIQLRRNRALNRYDCSTYVYVIVEIDILELNIYNPYGIWGSKVTIKALCDSHWSYLTSYALGISLLVPWLITRYTSKYYNLVIWLYLQKNIDNSHILIGFVNIPNLPKYWTGENIQLIIPHYQLKLQPHMNGGNRETLDLTKRWWKIFPPIQGPLHVSASWLPGRIQPPQKNLRILSTRWNSLPHDWQSDWAQNKIQQRPRRTSMVNLETIPGPKDWYPLHIHMLLTIPAGAQLGFSISVHKTSDALLTKRQKCFPRRSSMVDLHDQITKWKDKGNQIILLGIIKKHILSKKNILLHRNEGTHPQNTRKGRPSHHKRQQKKYNPVMEYGSRQV